MRISVISPSELSLSEINLWRVFQQQHPLLASPFFSPEFIQTVSAVQSNVQIGIMDSAGEVMGFFPFQRTGWRIGRPVGLKLCDLTGVIVRADVRWKPEALVRHCGLAGWHFQNLATASPALRRYEQSYSDCPYLDLESGFEEYEARHIDSGSSLFEELRRKSRKIQREIGPLRFEQHTHDQRVFDALLEWKSQQRERTKTPNVLKLSWAVRLIQLLREVDTPEFGGMLSALYAGNRLAAVHMGIRSRDVLHYWLPSFNRQFGKYSPGSILLLEMAKAAAAMGIRRLDLGSGDEQYKLRFKSGAALLSHGSVDCSLASRLLSGARVTCREWARSSVGGFVLSSKRMAVRAYYRALSGTSATE
jgi:CelD/BcsL family acetyltransferase involved in cellulose biosynthesis